MNVVNEYIWLQIFLYVSLNTMIPTFHWFISNVSETVLSMHNQNHMSYGTML